MDTFKNNLDRFEEVGTVNRVMGSLAYVVGLPSAKYGEVLLLESGEMGKITGLTKSHSEVLILSNDATKLNTKVARTDTQFTIEVGDHMLGRVVSPLGVPLGKPTSKAIMGKIEKKLVDISPPGIENRTSVDVPLTTGVSIVDLTIPLGKGQRQLIVGNRKTGKTKFLLQTVNAQRSNDIVCVYAGIGKRFRDSHMIAEGLKLEEGDTVLVNSNASDASSLIYLTPYTAMTIAEHYRDLGRDVLLILDDMSAHAIVCRELSLLANKFPGRSSYPGDIFYIHSKLLERAGNFKRGSITALPVAEISFGDLSGYIQTNLMSMTDGHIYFDGELKDEGREPAINPFLSVTRVGRQAQTPLLKDVSTKLTSFLVKYEKVQEFTHFGSESTKDVQKTKALGDKVMLLLTQSDKHIAPLNPTVFLLACLWAGFWKNVAQKKLQLHFKTIESSYLNNKTTQGFIDTMIIEAKTLAELTRQVQAKQSEIQKLAVGDK